MALGHFGGFHANALAHALERAALAVFSTSFSVPLCL